MSALTARRGGVWAMTLLLAAAPPLAAQTAGRVTGVVRDSANQAPLSDARVTLPTLGRSTISDSRGQFRLLGLPAGQYPLVTQRIGFAADTVSIRIENGRQLEVTVTLHAAAAVIAPLVVSATQEIQNRNEGSLTIDGLSGTEIRETRATHPAGILNRLAGVHVSETSGEGHMMAMRLQVTTAPMYLYLEDGIPTRATGFFNHNALYEVNLPQAGGIEVIKGPGSALYGSDAIGGVVNVMTRPAPLTPSAEVNLEGGSHGYRRMLATGGTGWNSGGVRADVNLTHNDNWKDAAPFDRQSATLRWDQMVGGWSTRTVLTGSRIDQQDVPAVNHELYQTRPGTNLAPIAYRTARAVRLSSAWEYESGHSLLSITPYARYNTMGLLPSWQLTYDPQVWQTDNRSIGLLLRYRRDVAPWQGRVIVGVDGDLSPGSFVAHQAITERSGPAGRWASYTTGPRQYDYDVRYHGVAPWIQTSWTPTAALHLDAGLRADFSGYNYETHLAPIATGRHRIPPNTDVSYRHLSPKLGLSWELDPRLSLYGSYRRGFRVPSFGQLFTQNSAENTTDLKPVTVTSWEAGIRGQLGARMVYQVAGYVMTLRDDILTYITPENTREARNAGSSRHRGIELSAGLALSPTLRLDLAWSIASHRYLDWTPEAARDDRPAVSYSHNLIEQAPRTLGAASLGWSPRWLGGGQIAIEWSEMGRYAQDPANSHFYPGHQLLTFKANANIQPHLELFARVTNLTNRRYAELSSYDVFQGDTYTPGAPRTLVGGMRYAY